MTHSTTPQSSKLIQQAAPIFDQNLEKLEKLIAQMADSKDMPVENFLKIYQEANQIYENCQNSLENLEIAFNELKENIIFLKNDKDFLLKLLGPSVEGGNNEATNPINASTTARNNNSSDSENSFSPQQITQQITLDQALKQLEQVIEKLSRNKQITLTQFAQQYQEALALQQICQDKINSIQEKTELIQNIGENIVSISEFEKKTL